jgi:hypothetical protein
VTFALPLILIVVLGAIALLHGYWGLGGRWPARDEASLSAMVVGRTPGGRMPPAGAAFGVCLAILAGVGLVAALSFAQLASPLSMLVLIAYGVFTAVFALRGAAGYVPALWRRSAGTPFVRLNTRYYSPLCLLLGAGLILNALGRG